MSGESYTRRALLRGGLLLAGAARMPGRGWAAEMATSAVRTPLGAMRGALVKDIRVFRGVPFAEPPVGDLRFRPPLAKKPWTGELDATKFGPEPWQHGTPHVAKSEDCLQLNVWSPTNARSGSLPVFVWIHGGGFTGGHAFDEVLDGTQFAREGIVCITVAYRLGVFGFLNVGPLLGATYDGSANNALHDLISALEWVRDNVPSLGGDPSRVTIGGESAGAKLCDILMGTPAATGLFHSVISESGGAERVWSRANSQAVAEGYGKTWRTRNGNAGAPLKTGSPATLIEAQETFTAEWPQHFPLRCEVDGNLLPRLPIQTITGGSTRGKRLLLGTNRDESALFVGPHPAHDATGADLGNLSVSAFTPVYERYASLYPELTVEQLRIRALTAEEYWIPSMRVAAAHVKNGGETYVYRLDFAETAGRFAGYAFHSEDVELVWNRPGGDAADRPAASALAAQMHAAWAAFIKGEAPSAAGLPVWPQWTANERRTMLLDRTSTVAVQSQEKELQLWSGLL